MVAVDHKNEAINLCQNCYFHYKIALLGPGSKFNWS